MTKGTKKKKSGCQTKTGKDKLNGELTDIAAIAANTYKHKKQLDYEAALTPEERRELSDRRRRTTNNWLLFGGLFVGLLLLRRGMSGQRMGGPIQESDFSPEGLRQDRSHLNRVGLSLLSEPRETQALYVDVVTFRWAKDKDACRMVNKVFQTSTNYGMMNATAIGNTAYLALHAVDEETRLLAENLLKNAQKWYENRG